jgi:choline dehydrogenase-like flavoprotein
MNAIDADVVIIGSGPAGVSAAWPLVEADLSVTMLDAAEKSLPDMPSGNIGTFRRSDDGWRYAFGDNFLGLGRNSKQSPKLATRLGQAILAPHRDTPSIHAINFLPVRSFSAGGLSGLWGALVSAFDDHDLRNYPLSSDDLTESYQRVAARIGLSGIEDDLAAFHGRQLPLQEPTWIFPIARWLLDRYSKVGGSDFTLGMARNAVATEKLEGRESCNRCGLCLYGCARGAIYAANQDLLQLCKRPNFKYLTSSRVTQLIQNSKGQPAVRFGVSGLVASGRAIIMAAGTLNSTALVFSKHRGPDRKLRLLTNPVAAMAFVVPAFFGQRLADSSFSLGQLSYRLILDEMADYATGVIYAVDSLPWSYLAQQMPFSRPAALRLASAMATSMVVATLYLPSRFSSNTLLFTRGEGKNEELHIEGQTSPETFHLLRLGAKRLARAMRRLGVFFIPGSLSIPLPGTDGHPAGTLPMQKHGDDFSCTPDCEIRAWPNVFIVDGSCLPDLPAKHPTFTIMANADRVGRIISKRLASAN